MIIKETSKASIKKNNGSHMSALEMFCMHTIGTGERTFMNFVCRRRTKIQTAGNFRATRQFVGVASAKRLKNTEVIFFIENNHLFQAIEFHTEKPLWSNPEELERRTS